MNKDFQIIKTLHTKGFNILEIEQIVNYLETLDYDLMNTKYIGNIISKNERLAKYFFLRDKIKIQIKDLDETNHIIEILDQCIDWSDFWRLLVVKKGFCCIRILGELQERNKFIFLSGPNILSENPDQISNSIFEDINY